MRIRLVASVLGAGLLGITATAQAQVSPASAPSGPVYYVPAAPVYSYNYAFKDEPLVSINRSYLGYSNLTYTGPGSLSPFGAAGRPAPPAYAPRPVPVRRGFGLFGRRRAYGY